MGKLRGGLERHSLEAEWMKEPHPITGWGAREGKNWAGKRASPFVWAPHRQGIDGPGMCGQ